MNQYRNAVTPKDRQLVESMFVTMTAKQIAEKTGRPIGGVKEILRYSDVRKNRKYTPDELELIKSDLSNCEVAKRLDRTQREISTKRWIMRNQ